MSNVSHDRFRWKEWTEDERRDLIARAYDLRLSGHSFAAVGRCLGVDKSAVRAWERHGWPLIPVERAQRVSAQSKLTDEQRERVLRAPVELTSDVVARQIGISPATVRRIRHAAAAPAQGSRRKRDGLPGLPMPPRHEHHKASQQHWRVVQEAVKHWCETGWLVEAERSWSVDHLETTLSSIERLTEALDVPAAKLRAIIARRQQDNGADKPTD